MRGIARHKKKRSQRERRAGDAIAGGATHYSIDPVGRSVKARGHATHRFFRGLCRIACEMASDSGKTVVSSDHRDYKPDFIVRVDNGRGAGGPVNLIVEVSGKPDADKEAKAATARNLWVPAVNNAGSWGRWAFVEIKDPWDTRKSIRTLLSFGLRGGGD